MLFEYRCLICDWMWESDNLDESCPMCDEYDDVYMDMKEDD